MGLMARVMLPLQEREAFIDVVLAQRVQVAFVGHLPCSHAACTERATWLVAPRAAELHAAVRMESDESVMNQVMKMTTTKAKGHGP